MELELQCPDCDCRFPMPAEGLPAPADETGWALPLGDGHTVEDMLYTSFASNGPVNCPECSALVPVTEQDLNGKAMELLAQW